MKIRHIIKDIDTFGSKKGKLCNKIEITNSDLNSKNMSIKEITQAIQSSDIDLVSITGDISFNEEFKKLLHSLLNIDGKEIQIFTDGKELFDHSYMGGNKDPRLLTSIIIPTPVCDSLNQMNLMNLCYMTDRDSLIFIINNLDDMKFMKEFITTNDIESHIFAYIDVNAIEIDAVIKFLINESIANPITIQYW